MGTAEDVLSRRPRPLCPLPHPLSAGSRLSSSRGAPADPSESRARQRGGRCGVLNLFESGRPRKAGEGGRDTGGADGHQRAPGQAEGVAGLGKKTRIFFFRLHRALRETPRGREQRQSTLLPGSWERKEVAQMARDWAPPVGGVAPSMPLRAGSCLASLLLACPGLQGGGGEKGNREARQLRGSRRLPAAPPPVSPELLVIDGRGCMFCSQATPSTSFALPHPHWPSSSLLGLPALRGLLYVLGVGGGRRHIPSDLRERKTQEARSRTKTRIQKNAY